MQYRYIPGYAVPRNRLPAYLTLTLTCPEKIQTNKQEYLKCGENINLNAFLYQNVHDEKVTATEIGFAMIYYFPFRIFFL